MFETAAGKHLKLLTVQNAGYVLSTPHQRCLEWLIWICLTNNPEAV